MAQHTEFKPKKIDMLAVSRQQKTINLSGVELEVKWCIGDDRNPTIIMLHEGLGCIGMWHDFPEQLCQLTEHPIFAYSRQGYGLSHPITVPRQLTYMHHEGLDVLPKLLKVADIKNHILLGHSDGGSIALINAGGNPQEELKAVITMAPHIFCEKLTLDSIKQSVPAFSHGKLRKALQKYHGKNVDCAFWGWNKAWLDPDFIHWNIEQYLPDISVPQLVIQGKDDPYGTTAQIEAITKGSKGKVTTRVLENCQHAPYKEQALRCLNDINEFLQMLPNI